MPEDVKKLQAGVHRADEKLASLPASWFHLCASIELNKGPVTVELCGRSYVGYRAQSGRVAVLSGRCSHMGAPLGQGEVRGERLTCPLHGWEYGPDGPCEKIPAADVIPSFARQCSYPAEECGGHVFFFNRKQARFPLPFFDGLTPAELLPTKPFELVAEAPWYFVGANGFDIQHFRVAHDRTRKTTRSRTCCPVAAWQSLQRGRARAGAEGPLFAWRLQPLGQASTGPRPCGRGRIASGFKCIATFRGFNGAAPVRARKAYPTPTFNTLMNTLQRGRARAGAEGA